MHSNSFASVGIEFDTRGIRAARIRVHRKKKETLSTVESLQELRADYSKETTLVEGLGAMAQKLALSSRDRVVVSLSGRQVYMAQLPFKELPPAEMKKALRVEIRKNLTFDPEGAELDYQILPGSDSEKKSKPMVMVTVVAKALLQSQMSILKKAGINPWIMEVLPAAIANSFWIARADPSVGEPHALLHFSPDICTAVIEGGTVPFYSRSIYFSAEECCAADGKSLAAAERGTRLESLGDELRRSLSFYSKTYGISNYKALYMLGDYIQNSELSSYVSKKLGLDTEENDLLKRIGSPITEIPGKYDIALALAMRGSENT